MTTIQFTQLATRQGARARLLGATMLSAGLLSAGGALAQAPEEAVEEVETETIQLVQAETDEIQLAQAEPRGDVVVVTGSRLFRDPNLVGPSPVQSVDATDITLSGDINVVNVVSTLPALIGSENTEMNRAAQGSLGASTLNLRNLGEERTLVLIDGRRHVGGLAGTAAVDVNTIPAALVERVEVMSGGASAVYGADAVTGVVNFIMKDDFEGLDVRSQVGVDNSIGSPSFMFSGTAGTNFASGRGNITGNFTYEHREGVTAAERRHTRGDRVGQVYGNPALVIQSSDVADYGLDPLLLGRNIGGFCAPGDMTLGGGQGALCDRIDGAPPMAIYPYPRFNLTSYGSLIGVDFYGDGWLSFYPGDMDPSLNYPNGLIFDLNNNGIEDCLETVNGTVLQRFGGFGGCHVTRTPGGAADVFQDGLLADAENAYFGGDGTHAGRDRRTIIPEDERYSLNFSARYDLTPSVRWFGEAKYVHAKTVHDNTGGVNGYVDSHIINWDNPWIPQNLRDPIIDFVAANPGEFVLEDVNILIGRDMTDFGVQRITSKRDTMRFVTGFEGVIADSAFNFEVSGVYGKTTADTRAWGMLVDRYYAAADAVYDPVSDRVVCRSELDPTASPPDSFLRSAGPFRGFLTFEPGTGMCHPLNLFGVGAPSPDAANFVMQPLFRERTIEQSVLTAVVAGDSSDFFSLPAGPIGVVFGGEYRKEKSKFYPDPLELPRPDPAGILDAFTPVFDVTAPTDVTTGSFNVTEVFGELSIPLLRDLPFARELTAEGAYRYSHYNTLGSTHSYNLRGIWSPASDIRFRTTYSQAVRAPNINELFSPLQPLTARPLDPCDVGQIGAGSEHRAANCAADGIPASFTDPLTARISGFSGGNPDLEAETAKTFTVGFVLQPRDIPGLSLSIDYYRISIADAIDSVNLQEILNACYDGSSFPNTFCDQFTRDRNPASPTYLGLESFVSSNLNFENILTTGIDYQLMYTFPLGGVYSPLEPYGDLTLRIVGNLVDRMERREDPSDPDAVNFRLYEEGQPRHVINFGARWRLDDLTVNWNARYYGKFLERSSRIQIENADSVLNAWTGNMWRHDVSASYRLTDTVEIYGGIKNLFNVQPILSSVHYPFGGYGREFFIGANFTSAGFWR